MCDSGEEDSYPYGQLTGERRGWSSALWCTVFSLLLRIGKPYFANSTVVISTEYFLTTFNVQYTIWNLCSAIYNMCTVQVHFVIASLCSRNNQRRLNFSPHRPAAPKLKSDDNEWCWWWRLQESHKEAQMAKQLRRFSSDLIPGHSKRLQRLENFFSKLSFFSQAFCTFQITIGSC